MIELAHPTQIYFDQGFKDHGKITFSRLLLVLPFELIRRPQSVQSLLARID